MSGWERLSAEGRSKRLKIWSPGLPISNPTSCNYYPPAPGAESIGNRLFRPLRPNVEPVPTHETSPDIEAPALPYTIESDRVLRVSIKRFIGPLSAGIERGANSGSRQIEEPSGVGHPASTRFPPDLVEKPPRRATGRPPPPGPARPARAAPPAAACAGDDRPPHA